MANDENSGGGLLSKVVKFVKNPSVDWSDLDKVDEDREATVSKQALKEMIERKRRNDFVRRREFDMLRKMRRQGVLAGDDPAARPSFFHSSLPSRPDDRAQTLRKIDEIEAQMSQQWWKAKGSATGAASRPQPLAPGATEPVVATAPAPYSPRSGPVTVDPMAMDPMELDASALDPALMRPVRPRQPDPVTLDPAAASRSGTKAFAATEPEAVRPPTEGSAISFAPTAPAPATPAPTPSAASPVPVPSIDDLEKRVATVPRLVNPYAPTVVTPMEVAEFVHDPELEEAAIRYANGDTAGAEAGLLEALGPGGSRRDHNETWMTLFDLYRSTGNLDRFESLAIDYAARFLRSAPNWIDIPSRVQSISGGQPSGPQFGLDWKCPSSVGLQTVAALVARLGQAASPWRLDWSALGTVEDEAVGALAQLFDSWCERDVRLCFVAPECLESVLREAAPSANASVDKRRWQLRLAALRMMNRPDEFELVALDYCVTYEVSPPSWEAVTCEYKALDREGNYLSTHTIVGTLQGDLNHQNTVAALMDGGADGQRGVDLSGEVLGDAESALALLDERLQQEGVTVVSCANLIRVDFSAAGTLLNWASSRQAEGREVHFTELNRLVATFFNVIGINEHARVSARRD